MSCRVFRRTAIAAALLAIAPVHAQPEQNPERGETLDAIEVTAQRRAQLLEEVPMALTALDADQLQARGIENLADLSALAPGLKVSRTISNNTISQISIRGVTQINPAIYWDPAVGVYVDGIYLGKSQGSIFNVVDLERVEVLRGPQGTLYGRNTLAGAINLITRRPTGSYGGMASLEVGNFNALVQRVSVDLPQVGAARVSLAARSERRDGWVETDRLSSRNELNDRRNDGLRLAVDADLSDRLTAEYRLDRSNVNQSNNFTQLINADLPNLAPFVRTQRQTRASVDAPSFEEVRILGHALTLGYQLGEGVNLKSISGYRRMTWNDSLDLDGSPEDVAFTQRFTDYDQWSQDLQLLISRPSWDLVGGVYYFEDEGYTDNPQRFFGGAATFDSQYGTDTRALAGYGQLDYRPVDMVTLSAGVRYTRERKGLSRIFGVFNPEADAVFFLIPQGTEARETFSATTPMVSAAWQLQPRLNLYLRYAEGFKSGGFNGEFSQPPSGDPEEDIGELIALNIAETRTPFRPERSKTLEAGLKSTFAGGRAQLNAAVFQNEITDLQNSIFLGSGAAATVIRNAGAATVRGVELEAAFIPFRGTTVRANLALLDPEYDEFIDGGMNVAGNRAFVHAPDYTFNVMVDSEWLRRDWGALRTTVDYAYTDAFFTYPYQLDGANPFAQVAANSEVQGHGLLNLRLAFTDLPLGAGRGELAFWVRNALDEDTASNFIDFGPFFGNLRVANFIEPRTFGLTGIVRW